jgi:coenzyme Q-binding protein COQ10
VEKQRPTRIHTEYIEGPLKYLQNSWVFRPDGEGGTEIDFCVDFAFKNRLFESLAGQMFDRALRRMIGAFEDRARELYGTSSSSPSPDGEEDHAKHGGGVNGAGSGGSRAIS